MEVPTHWGASQIGSTRNLERESTEADIPLADEDSIDIIADFLAKEVVVVATFDSRFVRVFWTLVIFALWILFDQFPTLFASDILIAADYCYEFLLSHAQTSCASATDAPYKSGSADFTVGGFDRFAEIIALGHAQGGFRVGLANCVAL